MPLTGRDEDLGQIIAALRAGVPVVLAGPPGVGKTRLASEALSTMAGSVTSWVRATEMSAQLPLSAVASLLPDDVEGGDALWLYWKAADLLTDRAAGRPHILVVDDAHLLDPESAALIQHLATSTSTGLLATFRTSAPLTASIDFLWREPATRRIDLEPLSPGDVSSLVEAALGGSVAAGVQQWAFERSQGNPLELHELLLMAGDAGSLVFEEGLWTLVDAPDVGPRLTDLIRARLGPLGPVQRRALELVALGEPVPRSALEHLVPPHVLEELERRRVLTTEALGRSWVVRTSHPLIGEVLRAELPKATLSDLHRQLAEAMPTAASRAGDALRVAALRLRAGLPTEANLLVRGAAEARAAHDHARAEELAAAAVDAGGGSPALIERAIALVDLDQPAQAEALLAEVAGDALPIDLAARAVKARVRALSCGLRKPGLARNLLARARDWHKGATWSRIIDTQRALVEFEAGDLHAAIETGASVASPVTGPHPELIAAGPVCLALLFSGRTEDARALVARTSAIADDHTLDSIEPRWLVALALSHADGGSGFADLVSRAEALRRRAAADRDRLGAAAASLALGAVALNGGRVATASRWFKEAALAGSATADGLGVLALALLARSAAVAGEDPAATWTIIDAARVEHPTTWWADYEIDRASVWTAAARGETTTASQLALEAAERCSERLLHEAHLLHDALRLGAPTSRVNDRLVALADQSDSPVVSAYADHARATSAGGAELDAAADRFEAMGANLLAAEVAAEAAVAHQRGGRTSSALAAARRRDDLVGRCEGARTPGLRAEAGLERLSRREREVVALAGRGLSNLQIAQRLSLSVRTVESHLYRGMTKGGVTRRTELMDPLGS